VVEQAGPAIGLEGIEGHRRDVVVARVDEERPLVDRQRVERLPVVLEAEAGGGRDDVPAIVGPGVHAGIAREIARRTGVGLELDPAEYPAALRTATGRARGRPRRS